MVKVVKDEELSTAVVDLGSLVGKYSGSPQRSVTMRLLFLAKRSADLKQKLQAAQLAVERSKQGTDTAMYKTACGLCTELGDAETVLDTRWVESADAEWRTDRERLEEQLSTARNGPQVKESLLRAHRALGDLAFNRGEPAVALKAFVRMRDMSVAPLQTLEISARLATAAAELGSWSHVTNQAAKIEHAIESSGSGTESTAARCVGLRAAVALAFLDGRQYKFAARKLIELAPLLSAAPKPEQDGWEISNGADLATYGVLTALATLERAELRSKCVESVAFRNALAVLSPTALALLKATHGGANYSEALRMLEELAQLLLLDPLMSAHVAALKRAVTDKCIAQYCAPYRLLCLAKMAACFSMDQTELESDVARLIGTGRIKARIDSRGKLLRAQEKNDRAECVRTLVENGEDYLREMKALLLRVSCLENDFLVRGVSGGPEHFRGGGGPNNAPSWARRRKGGNRLGGAYGARPLDRLGSRGPASSEDDDDDHVRIEGDLAHHTAPMLLDSRRLGDSESSDEMDGDMDDMEIQPVGL